MKHKWWPAKDAEQTHADAKAAWGTLYFTPFARQHPNHMETLKTEPVGLAQRPQRKARSRP